MKLVRVSIAPFFLELMVCTGELPRVSIKGLPPGSRFCYSYANDNYKHNLVFTHESFRELKDGEEIP